MPAEPAPGARAALSPGAHTAAGAAAAVMTADRNPEYGLLARDRA
ncbi:hypothetical protein [Streptomyces carminius]|nr:hypothetical protein [Streptomyces carminius]